MSTVSTSRFRCLLSILFYFFDVSISVATTYTVKPLAIHTEFPTMINQLVPFHCIHWLWHESVRVCIQVCVRKMFESYSPVNITRMIPYWHLVSVGDSSDSRKFGVWCGGFKILLAKPKSNNSIDVPKSLYKRLDCPRSISVWKVTPSE